jgi:hypothetical protein
MIGSTLDFARRYFDLGWRPIPIPTGQKGPKLPGWPDLVITEPQLARYFGRGQNIGVVLRPPLVDVDLDCREAVTLAPLYLPATGAVFGRPAKPGSHRLYIAEGAVFETFADPLAPKAGNMLLELRSSCGHQTIFPPSIADGEVRAWESAGIAPRVIRADWLRLAAVWLAIGCLAWRYLDEATARRSGRDLPDRLFATDHRLGETARRWLRWPVPRKEPEPESPQRQRSSRRFGRDNHDLHMLAEAIPNVGFSWWDWSAIGMAFYAADPGNSGLAAFDLFSRKHPKYQRAEVEERWANFRRYPPNQSSVGRLIHLANGGRLDYARGGAA